MATSTHFQTGEPMGDRVVQRNVPRFDVGRDVFTAEKTSRKQSVEFRSGTHGRPMRMCGKALFRVVIAALFLACSKGTVSFATENPRLKKEMQAIRAVIEENFRASNAEDVEAVLATMTPYTPNKERFIEELKQFFADTDVYMRLIDVAFISAEMSNNGPAATVRVIQQTLPKTETEIPYSEFRTRSAMLPPWEVCQYEVVMHKLRGGWKAHMMGGDVREAELPDGQAKRQAAESDR